MNSGSSTEPHRAGDTGLQAWHFYLLLSMAAAIWAVAVARDTHPAALLLVSGAVIASGLAAAALYYALTGFLGIRIATSSPPARLRDAIVREKTLVLRSIKELEFDHAMRKVSDQDFAEIGSRLRARAMELIEDLDRLDAPSDARTGETPFGQLATQAPVADDVGVFAGLAEPAGVSPDCKACGTANDADARFCKGCGAKLT